MKNLFISLSLFFAANLLCAQNEDQPDDGSDSTGYEWQTDTTYSEDDEYEEIYYRALPDSLPVQKQSFSEDKLNTLKSDPDLNYKQAPTVAESLWDRFLRWLSDILKSIFENAVGTNWGRVIVYIIGLALLIVVVMMLLRVNAFKVLYSGTGASQKYQVLEENIHEMDFESLIQEAIAQQDYRRGVRLVFLYALKLLSDKDLIHWQSGKTNHDYVAELDNLDLRTGLNELSFYFEYAWYGNFRINQEMFTRIQAAFSDWKTKIS